MAVSGYCCGVWHHCKGTHYRRVHQKFTTITFLSDGQVMVVKRNKMTSQFNCPRCRKSFSEPSTLRVRQRMMSDGLVLTRRCRAVPPFNAPGPLQRGTVVYASCHVECS
ncbi:uncharacterized protein B0H18DRAFT_175799 [Fomitopsis serialis]|uniref:uncharacterized protein n=1 Tax=Fomitopsis serialis TaxID=139415 RepID=UPI00200785FE|nr:uncharacterized protein B0H18DRAFT_175799 [Neoantrodia serialis]KAH9929831.1 hypothetical protein B0H18DRAFT_175799 [Neoantrodia serialis]